jgi:hypothetical protein
MGYIVSDGIAALAKAISWAFLALKLDNAELP